MIAAPESLLKICYSCRRALPLDQFPCRRRGSTAREGRCRNCRARYMRGYRKARRTRTVRHFVSEVRRAESLQRVIGLCATMFNKFGGVEGFVRAWRENIDAAVPGSPACLRTFLALARMAQLVEPVRQPPDLSQLTDEELEEELARLLSKALEDQG